MAFKIGQAVQTAEGKDRGKVVDILRSEVTEVTFYRVVLDIDGRAVPRLVDEGSLEAVKEFDYDSVHIEFSIDPTIVVARMYVGNKEVARGHGHMIHEDELGVAQAASWALKKIYEHFLNNNNENGGN